MLYSGGVDDNRLTSELRIDLTPLDVRYQEFRMGLRGYQVTEVRDYLNQVAEKMSGLVEDNERMRLQMRDLESELARAREGEAELKRAVVAAERIAREIKSQAEREAEIIKRETESERQAALQELVDQMKRMKQELEQARSERDLFVSQFRAMLEGYITSIDRFKK